jgi:hypothetical protein
MLHMVERGEEEGREREELTISAKEMRRGENR